MKFAARVNDLAGHGAAAWDIHYQALIDQETDPEVIVLSVGDPDFSTPPEITEAGIVALRAGDTHYTPILGRTALRERIAELFEHETGVAAEPAHVAVLAGAQNALFSASLCLLQPGDEVIVLDPMYVTYEAFLGVSGARIVRIPSQVSTGFRPALDRLEAAISEKTRAIAFSNPNNPSGAVFSRAELDQIGSLAKAHDLWVIADEVYSSLTFARPHTSIAALDHMFERTVTINSLSKSHAMTGWRLGWMIAPPALIKHVENLALCMLYGLPGFIQQAGLTALGTSLQRSQEARARYLKRKSEVCQRLAGIPKLKVLEPEAGMFLLVDISATQLDTTEFCRRLYAEHKVSVLDGSAFGDSTQQCVRLSLTVDSADLNEACGRIVRFIDDLTSERHP